MPPLPSWYKSPNEQERLARTLWPYVNFPSPPRNYIRTSESQVLLLHYAPPGGIEALIRRIVPPTGYTLHRTPRAQKLHEHGVLRKNFRYLSNVRTHEDGPVWLLFDPENGRGKAPRDMERNSDATCSVIISALIQFPDWASAWTNGAAAPYASGSLVKFAGAWDSTLGFTMNEKSKQLVIDVEHRSNQSPGRASPSAKAC